MKLTVILSILIFSLGFGGASFAQNVGGPRLAPKGKPGGSTLQCVPGPSSIAGALSCDQGARNVSIKVTCKMENIPSAGTSRMCMIDVGNGLRVGSEEIIACSCPCKQLPIPMKCDITNF